MTRVVVDTDVVSFIFKNHPIGAPHEADLAGCTFLISFMTLAELDQLPAKAQTRWALAEITKPAAPAPARTTKWTTHRRPRKARG